jgi:hypothetical protein
MLAELVIGIHDGEVVLRTQLTVLSVPVPHLVRHEEVVGRHLPSEGIGRDIKKSVTMSEVINVPWVLVVRSLPGRVVHTGEKGVVHVLPGLLEARNRPKVVLQSSRQHQLVILYFPAVL